MSRFMPPSLAHHSLLASSVLQDGDELYLKSTGATLHRLQKTSSIRANRHESIEFDTLDDLLRQDDAHDIIDEEGSEFYDDDEDDYGGSRGDWQDSDGIGRKCCLPRPWKTKESAASNGRNALAESALDAPYRGAPQSRGGFMQSDKTLLTSSRRDSHPESGDGITTEYTAFKPAYISLRRGRAQHIQDVVNYYNNEKKKKRRSKNDGDSGASVGVYKLGTYWAWPWRRWNKHVQHQRQFTHCQNRSSDGQDCLDCRNDPAATHASCSPGSTSAQAPSTHGPQHSYMGRPPTAEAAAPISSPTSTASSTSTSTVHFHAWHMYNKTSTAQRNLLSGVYDDGDDGDSDDSGGFVGRTIPRKPRRSARFDSSTRQHLLRRQMAQVWDRDSVAQAPLSPLNESDSSLSVTDQSNTDESSYHHQHHQQHQHNHSHNQHHRRLNRRRSSASIPYELLNKSQPNLILPEWCKTGIDPALVEEKDADGQHSEDGTPTNGRGDRPIPNFRLEHLSSAYLHNYFENEVSGPITPDNRMTALRMGSSSSSLRSVDSSSIRSGTYATVLATGRVMFATSVLYPDEEQSDESHSNEDDNMYAYDDACFLK